MTERRSIPYARQSIDERDVEAVAAVFDGDWLSTGPFVDRFERELEAVTGAPAVSVTSGTAALHVAYAALGVGPGSTVITTPLTFVATASTAALLGATVAFADVEPDTGLISPDAVAALVDDSTAVVAAVDYAGVPADYGRLREVLPDRVHLLDDAAHSLGASRNGIPVGLLADVTTLSFFATKNITTAEGGAIVSPSDVIEGRARRLRNHGLVRDRALQATPDEGPWHQEVHAFGWNYRLPDVLAALGSSQLAKLPAFLARRQQLAERYQAAFADMEEVILPMVPEGVIPAWHLFPIRVPPGARRAVFDHLRDAGILAQVNYMPAYWHPVFAAQGYERGLCPQAEAYYAGEISLPMYVDLTDDEQDRVVAALKSAPLS